MKTAEETQERIMAIISDAVTLRKINAIHKKQIEIILSQFKGEIKMPSEEEIKIKARREGKILSTQAGEFWRDGFRECGTWIKEQIIKLNK